MSIAFLHTAAVHVASFDALLREIAPEALARHFVEEGLLADAMRNGLEDANVKASVARAVEKAAASARVVLCTCSTIGGLAEEVAPPAGAFAPAGVQVMRVDRPMAERAVELGPSQVVVAAVESTLAPTRALLTEVATDAGVSLELRTLLVEHAWPFFEAGDINGYLDAIAAAIETVSRVDVIVLAQASMAGVTARLKAPSIPILSSPRLGLEAAIALTKV